MDFILFSKVVLLFTLMEPIFISFLCWPSVRNFNLLHSLPLALIGYIGGVYILFDIEISRLGSDEPFLGSLLVTMIIGALFHALFFYFGFKLESRIKLSLLRLLSSVVAIGHRAPSRLIYLVAFLALFSALIQFYAYHGMGFSPLFAENPFEAKFFAGQYADRYAPFAAYLRLGFQTYVVIAPLFLICIPRSFWGRVVYLILVALAAFAILLSLKRSIIGSPFLDCSLAFCIFYRKGRYASFGFVIYILIFTLGTAANSIFFYIVGLKQEFGLEEIVSGATDVSDLLWFWSGFHTRDYELSFGRTVFGGLVPFGYEWNPPNVTKLAIGSSVQAPTGGFRLPNAVWGYVAFGYVGAAIWPALLGVLSGIQTSLLQKAVSWKNISFFQFFMLYYVLAAVVMVGDNLLSISLDIVTFVAVVLGVISVAIGRRTPTSGTVKS